jgi:hypothetical protein
MSGVRQNDFDDYINPLSKDDRCGSFPREGRRKRVRGETRKLVEFLEVEHQVYVLRATSAVRMRSTHQADLLELFGGMAEISVQGSKKGLRVVNPIDKSHGTELVNPAQLQRLHNKVMEILPVVSVIEIMCTDWSQMQNLNFYWRPRELEERRKRFMIYVKAMARLAKDLHEAGCFALLENPCNGELRQLSEIQDLLRLPGFRWVRGDMCPWDMRGGQGLLMEKGTGWASNAEELLEDVNVRCSDDHPRVHCVGSNAKREQVYPVGLAKAIVKGIEHFLPRLGDERYAANFTVDSQFCWATAADGQWDAAGEPVLTHEVLYLDMDKSTAAWEPILQDLATNMDKRSAVSLTIKPHNPMYEPIRRLTPWSIWFLQVYRLPKACRLPTSAQIDSFTHRGAALLHTDGTITIDSEAVAAIAGAPSQRFDKAVKIGIFIYGEAPVTAVGEADREPEQAPAAAAGQQPLDQHVPDDEARPWEPGAMDITFPGLPGSQVPSWMKSVLRRTHCNLGHLSNQSMVRQFAQGRASGQALLGARGLRCAVCLRTRPPRAPRPGKHTVARRFNDRLMCDIVFVNFAGVTYAFLNLIDDATVCQVLVYLKDRTPEELIKVFLEGWVRPFGIPDALLLDQEGAIVSDRFAEFACQCALKLRFVPRDAHWQVGKPERHGFAVRWIMEKIVSQYGFSTVSEMVLAALMATHGKSTLIRRSRSAPAQCVYGRLPKTPAALLSDPDAVETKEQVDRSQHLREIESVWFSAMHYTLEFENHAGLRNAMLRKGRPWRGPFEPGQRTCFWRDVQNLPPCQTGRRRTHDMAGYRQGIICALDPGVNGSVCVRTDQGRLVSVAREQLRAPEGEELWMPSKDDLELLRDTVDQMGSKTWSHRQAEAAGSRQADDQLPEPQLVPPAQEPVAAEAAAEPPADLTPSLDGAGFQDDPLALEALPPVPEDDLLVALPLALPPALPPGQLPPRPAEQASSSSRARSCSSRRTGSELGLPSGGPASPLTPVSLPTLPDEPRGTKRQLSFSTPATMPDEKQLTTDIGSQQHEAKALTTYGVLNLTSGWHDF